MVVCPWCHQAQLLVVDPSTRGRMVQDCDVCCRPWQVFVERGPDGELWVQVDRA
ncbi:MAG: CPXCG motif-containing cysteine-rich protein [Deltaproteobacteria bacterium]|nr:CPXCG motif-containing cysteine-rich protein [Deltaproteobacteria bacterium]